jgi:hypothetical protein
MRDLVILVSALKATRWNELFAPLSILEGTKWSIDPRQALLMAFFIVGFVFVIAKVFFGRLVFVPAFVTPTAVLNRVIPGRKRRKAAQDEHTWVSALATHPHYCNVCEQEMDSGLTCRLCGYCSHVECFSKMNAIVSCKKSSMPKETVLKHRYEEEEE